MLLDHPKATKQLFKQLIIKFSEVLFILLFPVSSGSLCSRVGGGNQLSFVAVIFVFLAGNKWLEVFMLSSSLCCSDFFMTNWRRSIAAHMILAALFWKVFSLSFSDHWWCLQPLQALYFISRSLASGFYMSWQSIYYMGCDLMYLLKELFLPLTSLNLMLSAVNCCCCLFM